MPKPDRTVDLLHFLEVEELLEAAFPAPPATPDHLSHAAERAEQALSQSTAAFALTRDAELARKLPFIRQL